MSIIDRVVSPSGPTNCEIYLVGEALGAEEVVKGENFVGNAGKKLNELLGRAGINRAKCRVGNVIRVKPFKNDISTFIKFGTVKATVINEDYYKYRDLLFDDISACPNLNVIVALGNVPLYALTGKIGIKKWRGSILEHKGIKVIPTYHPSSTFHQFLNEWSILADFKRVRDESKFSDRIISKRNLVISPTFDEAMDYMESILKLDVVGFDIEVSRRSKQMTTFALAISKYEGMCIPLYLDGRERFDPYQEVEIMLALGRILSNPSIRKIGQNIIFDASFMLMRYGIVTRNMDDTMIAHGVLFPDLPRGLDYLTSIYTDVPYYKDDGKTTLNFREGSDIFQRYNAKDAVVLPEILPKLMNDLDKFGNVITYDYQVKLIEPLMYMSARGIRMDVDGMNAESARIATQIQDLTARFKDECKDPTINPNSNPDLRALFYGRLGIKPYVKRGTGKVTLDKTALQRISAKGKDGSRQAKILLELRRASKLKSTYLDVVLSEDGRLKGSFNPVGGADTGRLSSSADIITGEGTNRQNQPSSMSKFMLVDEGYIGYEIDLSQAENRIVAYIAPEPKMIAAFESGIDIHDQTAALIYGKNIEDVSHEIGTSRINPNQNERFDGKQCNHALNYDRGYVTFSIDYEIPQRQAKQIIERYHYMYPGIRQYHRWVVEKLNTDSRRLTNPFGRTRVFINRWGDNLFKEAYAFIPQSTVADKMNRECLIPLYYEDEFKLVEILNQKHDSVVFQIPISVVDRHEDIIRDIVGRMTTPIIWHNREIAMPVDVNATVTNFDKNSMIRIDLSGSVTEQLNGLVRSIL